MPRRRSAITKGADPGWHHIVRLPTQEMLSPSPEVRSFFAQHLQGASRLEVEIGAGAGNFLLAAASQFPHTTFVGIEWASRFIRVLRDRVLQENLQNVHLLWCDAKFFLKVCLPEESVDAFHIYFPDPWPRRAQKKKRILAEEGLQLFETCLKKGGKLFFATDSAEYCHWLEQKMQDRQNLKLQDNGPGETSYVAYGLKSHFGERFIRQGKAIFSKVFQKN